MRAITCDRLWRSSLTAPPDVVEALCEAHPVLDTASRPLRPLLELLDLLPSVADAAACHVVITAAPATCDASGDL